LLTRPRRGVVMLTLAPELADPADVARLAAAGGAQRRSYGCDLRSGCRSFAHGVSGVTHLYNAMSPLQHRAPGVVGASLDHDDVFCGIIADGVHVAGSALRLAVRAKGADRLMLVTDAMPGVGNGGKPFLLDGREIFVRDGICTDAAGTLAGSGLDMAGAVRNMVELARVDVPTASRMASGTPAAFMGLSDRLGTLAPGQQADFVVLDAGLAPRQTWIAAQRQPA
jgi:N-acetylglucosamine-6-phosphate deacetylase